MLSMIDFSPLLATHAFNDSGSRTTFLCDPTWQHSFYHISSPLATHAFNDSSSSTTFLLSIFSPPPLATHALRPYLTTFLLSNFPPPWQPMLSMIRVQVQHPFYQFFPPPLGNPCFATLPDNIPFIKFSPPLGNPCFQWFEFKYNIPFINFFPPPLGNPCFATLPDNIRPPLATHAFNDSSSSTTFLLSKIFPPLGNPCFATLPDNIPFIKFPPPPWQPMLSMIQVPVQHSFYQIFPPPPLGNPCFATLPDNIPFIKFSPPWQPMLSMIQVQVQHSFLSFFPPPPLGNPCFATLPDNIPFIKFSPPWQPMLSMIQVQVQHSFYQFFSPPPPLATHALRPYLTTFLLSNFPPPWQPILSMIQVQVQHSFYEKISPPLGKEQPEASQRHAKHQAYSSATPPNYFINQQCRTKIGPHNTPYSHT